MASPFGRRHAARAPLSILITFLPWLVLFAIFTLAPAVAIVPISFTDLNGYPGLPVNWIGTQNYEKFFGPSHWADTQGVLLRTAIYCVAVSGVIVTAAMGLAMLLNQGIRGSNLWRAVIFLPTILGVTVTGLMWTLVLNPSAGPVATLTRALGIQTALLGDDRISFALVIFITIWSSLGYGTVIYLAALQAIPHELLEAASLDGAGAWQRFRNVTFPLLAPATTVNTLLAVIGSLQAYQLIYVLTNGRFNTSVLASVVLQAGFGGGTSSSTSQGYAAAVSIVQFLLILLVTLVIYVPLRRRESRLEI